MLTMPTGLAGNVCNEILHGFRVPSYEADTLARNRRQLQAIMSRVGDRYRIDPAGSCSFQDEEAELMCWALRLTVEDLGEEEFHTRTGYDLELGREILANCQQELERKWER